MPAWNAEQFVGEAIDSILAQTFKDFEFIIINDGSTDNTAKIIYSYKDPRIVFVDNTKNQGLIAVLNQGMDMARGEYIARMDADDISYPERLAKQLEFIEANPDVGVLGTSFQEFGDSNHRTIRKERFGLIGLIQGCKIGHPTVMLRKSVFDKHGLRYSSDYEACEDYELWSRAIRHTAFANLPDVLLKYRWHHHNISVQQKQLQLTNRRRIQENMLDYLAGSDNEQRKRCLFHFGNDKGISTITWLFGFIPLLKIKSIRASKRISLFCVIPLIKIKDGKVLLFHFIPVAKIGKFK